MPEPIPAIAAIAPSTPFVAPEELARTAGHELRLRLGANESSFGPSPRALAAMSAALPRTWWYGDPESFELRTRLAALHACSIAEITVASGIDELVGLAVRAYMAPGDAVVTSFGTYPTLNYHVSGFGGRLETVPYRPDGSVDVSALAAHARTLEPAIVYLANPDNPSGTFAPAAAVNALIAALPARSLLLLDEAYADFAPPAELLDRIVPQVIRMRTFSKAHGMAGARIAYALAPAEVVGTFQKIRLHYGVNRTAQIGALASLDDPQYVAQVAAEVAQGRADYYALARRLGLPFLRSQTNFVCMDAGSRERAEALVRALLDLGVFIRKPGAPPLDRFVRITVGTPAERAELAALLPQALAVLGAPAP